MDLLKKHIKQIEEKGIDLQTIKQQIETFKNGLPFVNLDSAAVIGHGIAKFTEEENKEFLTYYETKKDTLNIVKFVPASGAATRMFKFLFEFLKTYNVKKETVNAYINNNKATELSLFLVGLEKFPFYKTLIDTVTQNNPEYHSLSNNKKVVLLVKAMLDKEQLNYSFYPKGLFPFHNYKDHIATAFEEHLFEASLYAVSNGEATLHFTTSKKYKTLFEEEFKRIKNNIEELTNVKFNVSYSFQKEETDTIAVNIKNEPVINEDGTLHFRPSGHGALLSNLNDLDTDVIFIKNIDNVVVSKYKNEVSKHKKHLAGLLLKTQKQAFKYLRALDNELLSEEERIEIGSFLRGKLNVIISLEFEKYSPEYQIEYLKNKLNRPIRVCGIVQNEGEPGGGPFWVKNESGIVSLQIVESAQVDKKNAHQKSILKNATHFNPVDLVCGVKNYKGEVFNFTEFVDYKTCFITMKTKTGKDIKALELPGLWNGSMAYWNTIFVEVPLVTFNPVKTVTDLLKTTHQV